MCEKIDLVSIGKNDFIKRNKINHSINIQNMWIKTISKETAFNSQIYFHIPIKAMANTSVRNLPKIKG